MLKYIITCEQKLEPSFIPALMHVGQRSFDILKLEKN
jgi:hypothetical protein